jgi:crotonobetainyl-CoA:carnitine CoA-transferase CaiB-like acyl-CoA transferase
MCCAPELSPAEVLADPQVHAGGGFVEVPDGETTTALPSTPVDFGGTPWEPRSMAPSHGAHTDEVLRELGRDDASIASLRERGVVA